MDVDLVKVFVNFDVSIFLKTIFYANSFLCFSKFVISSKVFWQNSKFLINLIVNQKLSNILTLYLRKNFQVLRTKFICTKISLTSNYSYLSQLISFLFAIQQCLVLLHRHSILSIPFLTFALSVHVIQISLNVILPSLYPPR